MDPMMAAKERVSATIDALTPDLVSFLTEYLQHPSANAELGGPEANGQEASCQAWLAGALSRWKTFDSIDVWSVEDNRPNVAAMLNGTGGGKDLLFNGHSDVVPVPAELLSAWNVDPWGGVVQDGCIYGRGACDMKGPNASFFFAERAIRQSGVRLAGDVICTAVIGEESGSRRVGCDSILDRGYRAPLCIVAEPTDLTVVPTITGELYVKIRVKGHATHLANRPAAIWPHSEAAQVLGINAIEKMWKILGALMDLERQWGIHIHHPAMPPGAMTLNIATIKGGEYISSLAGECEAVISILFAPQFRVEDIQREIEAVIQRVADNDLWMRDHSPEIQAPYIVPGKQPVDHQDDPESYQILCDAFKSATGREARVEYAGFTSDANFLDERGQPCIMFGPGNLAMGTHGANEHIPITDLVTAAKVHAHMMIDWCGLSVEDS